MRNGIVFAAVFVFFCMSATVEAASLLGVSWDGTVSRIDESNGTGETVGDSGFEGVNALARSAFGQFFATSRGLSDQSTNLFTINPLNGAGTQVVVLDFGAGIDSSVRGLTFSSSDALYAINNGGGRSSTIGLDDLYALDIATGQATLVGNTGLQGIQALTTGPNGKLYGWDVGTTALDGRGLILLDPSTGVAADISDAIGETDGVDIQTLAFNSTGKLYGGQNALYEIDPSNGATTLIGSGGYADVRGFEFLLAEDAQPPISGNDIDPHRNTVPEPVTGILVGMGFLALLPSRRRSVGLS